MKEEESKWISVNDSLPANHGEYLVAYTSSLRHIAIARFCAVEREFFHDNGQPFITVGYWMPLPEPPSIK